MFPAVLSKTFEREALERDASTLVAIDAAGTILWVNQAWTRFAQANGGEEVLRRFGPGTSYLDGIGGPLRGFYEAVLRDALVTGEVYEHDYECSSADTFRACHMRALPLGQRALLLEHSTRVERPHDRAAASGTQHEYVRADGSVLQCSNCRRIRRAREAVWDWIPAWVRSPPPRVSHGLCGLCRRYYWA